ncbi:MAG TPA: methylated-DNA--[protein]-cysteine S-methyltransferase [Pseudolabrys sp.]|nr:methylated-DNA--[protein]-cysteine S-methyltransferase [Pseudolabrys sp.]
MPELHFALFETAIGVCGIVWTARGIAGVQIHDGSERATRARLVRRFAGAQEAAPPEKVQRAIDGIVQLLRGEKRDLSDVTLDVDRLPEFNRKVYDVARTIPAGETMTYGEIAARLGDKLLARDVGQALGQNPIPLIVPCHRVLAAGGKTGGFSAPGGVVSKLRLLTIEGAQPNGPTLFDRLPLATKRSRRS